MNILLNERPVKFLLAISKQDGTKSINDLGKDIYNTYKSRYELYEKFREYGIIEINDNQREVIISLNEKGKRLLTHITEIMTLK